MTAPSPSGGASALRVGGLALIGVAVITAIIGLVTLATGGGPQTNETAAPSTVSSSATPEAPAPPPGTEAPTPLPTYSDTVPMPTFPTSSPEGTASAPGEAPTAGSPETPAPAPGSAPPAAEPPAVAAPAPGGNGGAPPEAGGAERASSGEAGVVRAPLRVYNNSRIEGLAARAAEDFRRGGWEVTEVGAYGEGVIPVTTVYFRPGTDEEAPAKALGAQFGLRVNPRFEGLQAASPGIIVIVTREYGTQ